MQDRRPRFLQLISFSNLSMPENLVMRSAYSVHQYRLWDTEKKLNRVGTIGQGREFQTYVAFRFGTKTTTKKTFRGNQQNCWSKNLDRILLCSPQNKIFGNKFLRPQLTFAKRHGFSHTPETIQPPSPLGQNLDNEFLRENLLSSQKFVGRQLIQPLLFQFLLLMHFLYSDQVLYKNFLDFYGL